MTPGRRRRLVALLVIALLVLLTALVSAAASLYTQFLWFQELGYPQVFLKTLVTRVLLGASAAVAMGGFLWVNVALARGPRTRFARLVGDTVFRRAERSSSYRQARLGLGTSVVVFALFAASAATGKWATWLRFQNAVPFGYTDPLFGRDAAFYVFRFPIWTSVLAFLAWAVGLALLLSAASYVLEEAIRYAGGEIHVSERACTHLGLLSGALALCAAGRYYLKSLALPFAGLGVTAGAGFADVHARLPALYVLTATAVLLAVGLFIAWRRTSLRLVTYLIGGQIVLGILGQTIVPPLIQALLVRPNEFAREQTYIGWNIRATLFAYGLGDVLRTNRYSVDYTLTRKDLDENAPTVDNIRLWDHRPLLATFRQLQGLKDYYRFWDLDTDRYVIDGKLTQVMLSARQFEVNGLVEAARTWINTRLKFTHGYGLCMSPVNAVTESGGPEFIVGGFPLGGQGRVPVIQPEVYYGTLKPGSSYARAGELREPTQQPGEAAWPPAYLAALTTQAYVVAPSKMAEFDYPQERHEQSTTYAGAGGVPLTGWWRRLLFSIRFGDLSLCLTSQLSPKSRIQLYRQVEDRLRALVPFLAFDSDPYLVVADGRLFWFCDGYTVAGHFPYSQPQPSGMNYVRNSVKCVVDAYNGSVWLYTADPQDAMLRVWARTFPGLFLPLSAMPQSLQAHLRYPEDLFRIQAQMFNTYHMDKAPDFYRREDKWDIPTERFGSQVMTLEPYYIIMRLPGETQESFILMLPLRPVGRDNMIAWLCARWTDKGGELVSYEFTHQRNLLGPQQVETLIDQDPTISEQITLWDQRGSHVTRGNLMVIPINDTLLYVEPLYLQAEASAVPELKRVIVVLDQDRIAMRPMLRDALAAALGTPRAPAAAPAPVPLDQSKAQLPDWAAQVQEHLAKAREYQEKSAAELRRAEELWGQKQESLPTAPETNRGKVVTP